MKLIPKIYNYTQFTYLSDTKTFVVDESCLSFSSCYGRLYDDAYDVGFAIKGKKSTITFYLDEEEKKYNEIIALIFRPVAEDVQKFPELHDLKVVVFND